MLDHAGHAFDRQAHLEGVGIVPGFYGKDLADDLFSLTDGVVTDDQDREFDHLTDTLSPAAARLLLYGTVPESAYITPARLQDVPDPSLAVTFADLGPNVDYNDSRIHPNLR